MRLCLAVLAAVLTAATSYVMQVPMRPVEPRFATTGWLNRQKLVLELFHNICTESDDSMIVQMAMEFSWDNALPDYSMEEVVTKFLYLYKERGLLARDEIFSEYNEKHLEELQLLYNLFYYANDFDAFYKTAAWARQNVHCEIFADALYAAVMHRSDTKKFTVPAPYEILPNYFVPREDLAKGMLLYEKGDVSMSDLIGVHKVGNTYTIDVNYTGAFYNNEEESKISYFLEDVGLNSYYFFINIHRGHWSNSVRDENDREGEYWYYIIRQLNARHNLERHTNGLPEIEPVSWNSPISTGYDSMLMYNNGRFIPERVNNMEIDTNDVSYLTQFEERISTIVQEMNETNKTVVMNKIWDLIISSENNYDCVARRALGGDTHDTNSTRLPSALEHYASSLRDPVFWQLNKNILRMFNYGMQHLEPYAYDNLFYPGVEVVNIEVKKMQTYFDYFQFDVNNLTTDDSLGKPIHIKFGQPRLNHKPFSIMINVSSLVREKALVKIFIGPKFLPSHIGMKKDILKQLDSFEFTLKVGKNLIVRKSEEIDNISQDFIQFSSMVKKVEAAEFGVEPLYFTDLSSLVGYPTRLILPKGTSEGFPLQLYVMIAPFVKNPNGGVFEQEFNWDTLSPGYPFDRRIDDPKLFDLPNTMFKDIMITHKGDNKVLNYGGEGITKKWYASGTGDYVYDPESRKTFDYSSKKSDYKPYDYESKKGQHETKKFDYESKKEYHTTTEVLTINEIPVTIPESDLPVTLPDSEVKIVKLNPASDEVQTRSGARDDKVVLKDVEDSSDEKLKYVKKDLSVKAVPKVLLQQKYGTYKDQSLYNDEFYDHFMKRLGDAIKLRTVNIGMLENVLKMIDESDDTEHLYY